VFFKGFDSENDLRSFARPVQKQLCVTVLFIEVSRVGLLRNTPIGSRIAINLDALCWQSLLANDFDTDPQQNQQKLIKSECETFVGGLKLKFQVRYTGLMVWSIVSALLPFAGRHLSVWHLFLPFTQPFSSR
jgi:hypothetical protein